MQGRRIIFAAITAISSLTKIRSHSCTEAQGGAAVPRRRSWPKRCQTRCAACEWRRDRPNRRAEPANTRESSITLTPTDASKGLTKTPNIIYPEVQRPHHPHVSSNVPTNPDLLLRLRRISIGRYLRGKARPRSRSRPRNPRSSPHLRKLRLCSLRATICVTSRPDPAKGHPGDAPAVPMAMPPGGAPVTPPAPPGPRQRPRGRLR